MQKSISIAVLLLQAAQALVQKNEVVSFSPVVIKLY
jgi:hypothetical protein